MASYISKEAAGKCGRPVFREGRCLGLLGTAISSDKLELNLSGPWTANQRNRSENPGKSAKSDMGSSSYLFSLIPEMREEIKSSIFSFQKHSALISSNCQNNTNSGQRKAQQKHLVTQRESLSVLWYRTSGQ